MTTFNGPLYVGKNTTGNLQTSPIGYVAESTDVTAVSAAVRTATVVLPDNALVHTIQVVITSAVAGIAAGVSIRAGTAASPSLYGIVGVSAEGIYNLVLTKQILTMPTTFVIDATAQASAADLTAFKASPRVSYGVRY